MKISARDLDAIMRKSVGTRELDEDEKVVQSYTAPLKDFKPVSAKKIASRPKSFVKTKSGKYTPAKSAPMRYLQSSGSSPRRGIAKGIKKSFSDINEFSIKQFRNSNLSKSINEVRKYAAMISDNKMNLKDALDKLPNDMRDDLFSELRKIRGSKK